MRKRAIRIAVGSAVCAGVLLVAGVAGAAADSVKGVGGGWVSFPPDTSAHYAHFSFSAHTGPNGDFGQALFRINDVGFPLDVWAHLDCVTVVAQPPYRGAASLSGHGTHV